MLHPDLSHSAIGSVGETLALYKLERWGETVARMPPDNHYDLMVMLDTPVRIQVKSTTRLDGYSYQFVTTRGTPRNKRQYNRGEYDALCLVSLELELIYFKPFINQVSIRIHPNMYTKENEHKSWCDVLDKLGKK